MNDLTRRQTISILAAAAATACAGARKMVHEMNFIKIDGNKFAYEQVGIAGPDIVFVHGYLTRGTGPQYRALKTELSREYQLHCIDMRGHGGSAEIRERVTLDQCAADIVALTRELGLERPLFVGHSMGGFLGLSAAIKAPELFGAIAALTPSRSKGVPIEPQQVDLIMSLRADPDQLDAFNRLLFTRPVSQDVLDEFRTNSLLVGDAVYERWMREEWPGTDISKALSNLTLPTLFVNGLKDILVDPAAQHADAMSMPYAKEVIFTDEGHMMPFEAPDRCAKEILRFFGDLTPKGNQEAR